MAYLDCRQNKRNKHDAIQFEMQAEDRILTLYEKLLERTYHPSSSICFVSEKPKLREIFAANFEDRIIHHLLVRYLEKIWEPIFIFDSYASRKNKGIHLAIKRLQRFMWRASHNQTRPVFYMQLDIKNFFPQIDKPILNQLIRSKCQDSDIRWLTHLIIYHDPTKDYQLKSPKELLLRIPKQKSLFDRDHYKGLPIGNLTSQFFANIYLNELDQYVKHHLKCQFYMRYVDDFVLLHPDKKQLMEWFHLIQTFLKFHLRLELNEKRTKIQPISNGINFLGYIVRPDYILTRNRVVSNLKEKLHAYEKQLISKQPIFIKINYNEQTVESLFSSLNSYLGHFKHADTHRLKKKLFKTHHWLTYYFYVTPRRRLKRFDSCPKNFKNMRTQYLYFMKRFHYAIIFFQVGCFYEFYDQQAVRAVKILGLRYIKKKYGFNKRAGIGCKGLTKFIHKAIQNGFMVVVIQQQDEILTYTKKRKLADIYIAQKNF